MKVPDLTMLLCTLLLIISCEKKENVKNSDAILIGVTLNSGSASIDTANKKVLLKIPEGTDITTIIPHFEISANATIYPPTGVATNFSVPVTYTITSQDQTKQYIFIVSAVKQIAKFTVYDCSTWSSTLTRTLLPGSIIRIYSSVQDFNNSKIYDLITADQNATANFYGEKGKSYFLTVNKDNKSNIMNGYVLDGRYDDQSEIQNSPIYANAVVGGFKFKDINGDGRVWPDDRYNYEAIYIHPNFAGLMLMDLYVSNAQ